MGSCKEGLTEHTCAVSLESTIRNQAGKLSVQEFHAYERAFEQLPKSYHK